MSDAAKSDLRRKMKSRRARILRNSSAVELLRHFPATRFRGQVIAGFAPIGSEIDLCPLLRALHAQGETLALPVTGAAGTPLRFRQWTPGSPLTHDRFGAATPTSGDFVTPSVILVPLLAFDARGQRLGYGGGFYDRTLAALRATSDVFACGVGFAAQQVASVPTGTHDRPLDGILTEQYFKAFA